MAASQHSFGAQTYGHGQVPDGKTFWYGVIAVVGCFLLFIGVMFIAYIPPNSVDATGQPEVVQTRLARLEELRAKEATAAENYSWANEPQKIVRIPIERAVALLPSQLSEVVKPLEAPVATTEATQTEAPASGEATEAAAPAEAETAGADAAAQAEAGAQPAEAQTQAASSAAEKAE